MRSMPGRSCPLCSKPVEAAPSDAEFPFCSRRCKLLDLGHWLDERYRMPDDGMDRAPDHGEGDATLH